MKIETDYDRNILVFAFRYALGRKTYAVNIVCEALKDNWKNLREFDRKQIKKEITEAIQNKWAGDKCDVDEWKKILEL